VPHTDFTPVVCPLWEPWLFSYLAVTSSFIWTKTKPLFVLLNKWIINIIQWFYRVFVCSKVIVNIKLFYCQRDITWTQFWAYDDGFYLKSVISKKEWIHAWMEELLSEWIFANELWRDILLKSFILQVEVLNTNIQGAK